MKILCLISTLIGSLSLSIVWAEDSRIYTRKEAYHASDGQIMFNYGERIKRVEVLAEVLTEKGFTAVALPGAKPGAVYMRVAKSKAFKLTQNDIDSARAGLLTENLFIKRVGPPNKKQ